MLLGAIYEQQFYDFSYGFRQGRSAHQALDELRQRSNTMNIGWIVDADVSGFLETSSYYTPFHEGLSKRLG
jgi:retron-type reverse transcriptase